MCYGSAHSFDRTEPPQSGVEFWNYKLRRGLDNPPQIEKDAKHPYEEYVRLCASYRQEKSCLASRRLSP